MGFESLKKNTPENNDDAAKGTSRLGKAARAATLVAGTLGGAAAIGTNEARADIQDTTNPNQIEQPSQNTETERQRQYEEALGDLNAFGKTIEAWSERIGGEVLDESLQQELATFVEEYVRGRSAVEQRAIATAGMDSTRIAIAGQKARAVNDAFMELLDLRDQKIAEAEAAQQSETERTRREEMINDGFTGLAANMANIQELAQGLEIPRPTAEEERQKWDEWRAARATTEDASTPVPISAETQATETTEVESAEVPTEDEESLTMERIDSAWQDFNQAYQELSASLIDLPYDQQIPVADILEQLNEEYKNTSAWAEDLAHDRRFEPSEYAIANALETLRAGNVRQAELWGKLTEILGEEQAERFKALGVPIPVPNR